MAYLVQCVVCEKEVESSQKHTKYCSDECRLQMSHSRTGRYGAFASIPTGTIGAISELEVATDLMKRGYAVFRAVSPACFCDLIAIGRGSVLKLEVRTGYMALTGRPTFSKKTHGEVDCFGIYFPKTGEVIYYELDCRTVRMVA